MKAQINDIELEYNWINFKEEGPVILFLHEGLGSIKQWKGFPELLCEQSNLTGLVYDRQGHGNSSAITKERDESYLEDYALRELPAFLLEVVQDRPLVLFGHSDGGTIALIYASKFPSNVAAVITEAAHIYVEPVTWKGIEPLTKEFANEGRIHAALSKYHGEKTEQTFHAWSSTWLKKDQNNWDISHYLKAVKSPALLLQGKQDQYATQKHLLDIQARISSTSLAIVVDNCQHSPHLEQGEEVLAITVRFLKSINLKD